MYIINISLVTIQLYSCYNMTYHGQNIVSIFTLEATYIFKLTCSVLLLDTQATVSI